jgi:RHS repeat-associated protein
METKDKLYYYHNDINGAPLRLTDEAGNIVWNVHYNIFGKIDKITKNDIDNPIRMQGQYEDEETGLYYNRYRYYDPVISAYVSQDPIGLLGGTNLYSYPINIFGWCDPLGLKCWDAKRKEYWKNKGAAETANSSGNYSQNNIDRMNKGQAPKIKAEVRNNKTGKIETKDVSMELHHNDIPQRVGGEGVHEASNLKEVTPWEHEEIDPYRHTGSELKKIINDTGSW